MQLFKRVLLSLFPDEIITQNINPASMFVSFISTKEFFSVINRKIVENYKLNLFDVALDPFEFKIGFGDRPLVKMKNLDLYYWYCWVANLNWYRFLNPANVSNVVSLVVGIYAKESFTSFASVYYVNFLYTVYLLSFVFFSRIRVFVIWTEKEKYNWFIELFFEFYKFVFEQNSKRINKEQFESVKKKLISNSDIFILLFEYYQHINTIFDDKDISSEEYYSWLFYDDIKKTHYKVILSDFVSKSEKYVFKSSFSLFDQKILSLILPADILLRYLFMDADIFLVFDNVIEKIFDKSALDRFMEDFRSKKWNLEKFLMYISDYKNFKNNFFVGIQKYITKILDQDNSFEKDFLENIEKDDYSSAIWDDIENLESFNLPEKLKKESKMMERVLNFYITLIGWFWIARWDSFYLRFFRKDLIDSIVSKIQFLDNKKDTLNFYGGLLYHYWKNVFYYKYASENIRAGKQKFMVPYKSTYKSVYSNLSILKLFDQNFLVTILQDFSPRDLKIYVKSPVVISLFKDRFSKSISELVRKDNLELIKSIYGVFEWCLSQVLDFSTIISSFVTKDDVFNLKNNFYSLDFWLCSFCFEQLNKSDIFIKSKYSDFSILWIFSFLRETLFGFLLYIIFLEKEQDKNKKNYLLLLLKIVYVRDVLHVSNSLIDVFIWVLDNVKNQFYDILDEWIRVDDNYDFMLIAMENWIGFMWDLQSDEVYKSIVWEDLIWFRWFLKNITYYNKRFLIPK